MDFDLCGPVTDMLGTVKKKLPIRMCTNTFFRASITFFTGNRVVFKCNRQLLFNGTFDKTCAVASKHSTRPMEHSMDRDGMNVAMELGYSTFTLLTHT